MSFIDEAKIYLKAGNGGDGCSSFRREKFIEFGGPDGGNGGNGGNIIFYTSHHINTLLYFRYKQHIKAENGNPGSSKKKSGSSGKDVIIKVPIGTQLYDEDGMLITDLNEENQKFIAAHGGKGGIGNANYKTSTNRAPRHFTFGKRGEEKHIILKLKIISDVGIIGLPNAGKSSFLASCTNSKTKIADYPFTTLEPHLGVAFIDNTELVLADIPGLIPGAHLGHGIGDKFLKHIERCSILLHIIDCTLDNIIESYECIRKELSFYNKELSNKTEFIVLNKSDLLDKKEINQKKQILSNHTKKEIFISSIKNNRYPILSTLIKQIHKKYTNTKPHIYDPFNI
ncbi:GTPase ObgE [Ehrlichia canis]|uniref:GTPase Obg n=1 Tax=Ehrlichia canis (strain Jake) TaxID=269484 RepID=OBG_EHRCJ|nr:GTPase ObgE [Ehrlichia canis]Q3YRX8.1 RecName: Full=GTPase Obg; AltName: Full=GTP-binding protein Obg [Ehrlichia canis str. Jake]AAZ68527.1 GTP1/OBG sub- domain [Ehrlichia canis str. Jake]AUO54732.1 GTPase ObgE [Ehrlichia canis]UKC53276.1 obgE [Ehrlichia canis]UKC54213.1 obgE [Ehrlichia canis]UKC55149.1 obgE [Ehrlichia canis]